MILKKLIDIRLRVFYLAALIIIGVILNGCAVEKPKIFKIGILSGLDAFADTAEGFKAKMKELGYREGRDISYDLQKTNADLTADQKVLNKFLADKVDLIVAFPTSSAVAAKAAAEKANIPVVFANAGIEGNNLVQSVRQPGGNITGVRFPGSELTLKRLEFLHELLPEAKRIYIPYDSNYPGISFTLEVLRKEAAAFNLNLIEVGVSSLEELKFDLEARSTLADPGVDAILIMPTLLTAGPAGFGLINKFAIERKLAVAGSTNNNTEMGALFNYIPDNADMGRLAAPLADKIIKGVPVGTIPVVTPEARLRVNYRVAKELGLNISDGFLSRANEIIR